MTLSDKGVGALGAAQLFFAVATVSVAGLSVLAFIAGPLDPQWDAITAAAPALCLAGLLMAGLGLAVRARRLAGLAFAAAVLPGALMVAETVRAIKIPPAPAERAGEAGPLSLKVMTLNVLGGADNDAAVRALVLAERPDILILQEANAVTRRRLNRLIAALYTSAAPAAQGRGQHCPTRIFTRFPVRAVAAAQDCAILAARLAVPAGRGGDLTVIGVHLPRAPHRTPDTDGLRQAIRAWGAESAIMAGDFNTTPWSWALRRLEGAGGVTRRTAWLPTWPAPGRAPDRAKDAARKRSPPPATAALTPPAIMPVVAIDHIFATPDWKTASARTGRPVGSDHLPVIVELVHAPPPAKPARLSE